jgi:hypothetical protein
MDVFKFTNPTAKTKMDNGQFIEGIASKMWVEKYRDAGEFTFTAPIDSGVREALPIDTFISHMNTSEIMIVENHEINETSKAVPDVKITGRSLETFLDNRIVGSNNIFPAQHYEFIIQPNYTWIQAQYLINIHATGAQFDAGNLFPYLVVPTPAVNISGESIARTIPFDSVYKELLTLLGYDDLGIKVVRPGPSSPLGAASVDTALVIHTGTDRSKTVIFSYNTGEITSADYLWSNKTLKNAALVSGRWIQIAWGDGAQHYDRRTMFVDGSSIDKDYPSAPTGADLTNVVNAMIVLGREACSTQNRLTMSKAEIRRDATKAVYRHDYNLGDLITVEGDYNHAQIMRVSEFVEIEDSTGESGYPTLTVDSNVTAGSKKD